MSNFDKRNHSISHTLHPLLSIAKKHNIKIHSDFKGHRNINGTPQWKKRPNPLNLVSNGQLENLNFTNTPVETLKNRKLKRSLHFVNKSMSQPNLKIINQYGNFKNMPQIKTARYSISKQSLIPNQTTKLRGRTQSLADLQMIDPHYTLPEHIVQARDLNLTAFKAEIHGSTRIPMKTSKVPKVIQNEEFTIPEPVYIQLPSVKTDQIEQNEASVIEVPPMKIKKVQFENPGQSTDVPVDGELPLLKGRIHKFSKNKNLKDFIGLVDTNMLMQIQQGNADNEDNADKIISKIKLLQMSGKQSKKKKQLEQKYVSQQIEKMILCKDVEDQGRPVQFSKEQVLALINFIIELSKYTKPDFDEQVKFNNLAHQILKFIKINLQQRSMKCRQIFKHLLVNNHILVSEREKDFVYFIDFQNFICQNNPKIEKSFPDKISYEHILHIFHPFGINDEITQNQQNLDLRSIVIFNQLMEYLSVHQPLWEFLKVIQKVHKFRNSEFKVIEFQEFRTKLEKIGVENIKEFPPTLCRVLQFNKLHQDLILVSNLKKIITVFNKNYYFRSLRNQQNEKITKNSDVQKIIDNPVIKIPQLKLRKSSTKMSRILNIKPTLKKQKSEISLQSFKNSSISLQTNHK